MHDESGANTVNRTSTSFHYSSTDLGVNRSGDLHFRRNINPWTSSMKGADDEGKAAGQGDRDAKVSEVEGEAKSAVRSADDHSRSTQGVGIHHINVPARRMGDLKSKELEHASTSQSVGSYHVNAPARRMGDLKSKEGVASASQSVGSHHINAPARRMGDLKSKEGASQIASASQGVGSHNVNAPARRMGDLKSKEGASQVASAAQSVGTHHINAPARRMGDLKSKEGPTQRTTALQSASSPQTDRHLADRKVEQIAILMSKEEFSQEIDVDEIGPPEGSLGASGLSPKPPQEIDIDEVGFTERTESSEGVNLEAGQAVSSKTRPPQDSAVEANEGLAVAKAVEDVPLDLPQAEDVDLEAQDKRRAKHTQQNWRMASCGCLVVTLILIIVVILLTKDGGKVEVATSPPSQSSSPSQSPSMAPTSFQTSLLQLLPDSTQTLIAESAWNPQSRAFTWLLNDPSIGRYPSWRIFQRFALATFYYATNGDEWYNRSNWLVHDTHECSWPNFKHSEGMVAIRDPATFEIIGYEFQAPVSPCESNSQVNTSKEINTEVIRHIWMDNNGLEGTIPEEIALLTSLQGLAIQKTNGQLHGSIPTTIGLLTDLVGIDVSTSNLEGSPIPSEIGLCTNLNYIGISGAQLGGSIPSEIGNLHALEFFFADSNWEHSTSMTGAIPSELGRLENLRFLIIAANGLGGQLPSEIGLLTNLMELELAENTFEGTVPSEMGGMSSLEYLSFKMNAFTGSLPSELGLLVNMFWFVGRNNFFSGTLPSELGQLVGVLEFSFSNNELIGTIPSEFGGMGQYGMQGLRLNNNMLSGPIPSELGLIPELAYLTLQDNRFSSELPPQVGLLHDLRVFNITNNGLIGTVPDGLCFLNAGNCTYIGEWWEPEPIMSCSLEFDCRENELCGCDCVCSSSTV